MESGYRAALDTVHELRVRPTRRADRIARRIATRYDSLRLRIYALAASSGRAIRKRPYPRPPKPFTIAIREADATHL